MLVELVDGDVVEQVAGLAVELGHGAVLVAGDDVLAEVAPAGDSGLALLADNGQVLLVRLLCLHIDLDVQHDNGSHVTHALLGHTQQLRAVLVELDALHGGREVPGLEALAGLDVPKADCVVSRAGGEDGRCGVDVDSPDGTLVAAVRSKTLAIVREPHADLLVLGDREDEIAVRVVSVKERWEIGG